MNKKNREEPRYLTINEFAESVGYSTRHIRRLIKDSVVQAIRSEGRRKWRIPQSEISKLRGEQTVSPKEVEVPMQVQKEVNPLIMKNRGEHFEHLLGIVNLLLENEVDKVFGSPSMSDEPEADDYTIISEESDFEKIPRGYLVERIENNIEYICKTFSVWDFWDCFIPHLLADALGRWDFERLYNDHTIEFINILRMLAQRKTFKGTCPVCKDWS